MSNSNPPVADTKAKADQQTNNDTIDYQQAYHDLFTQHQTLNKKFQSLLDVCNLYDANFDWCNRCQIFYPLEDCKSCEICDDSYCPNCKHVFKIGGQKICKSCYIDQIPAEIVAYIQDLAAKGTLI